MIEQVIPFLGKRERVSGRKARYGIDVYGKCEGLRVGWKCVTDV